MCNMSDVFERKLNEKLKERLADQQKEYDKKFADQQEKFSKEFAEEKRKTVMNMLEKNLEDDLIISCTGVSPEKLAEIKAEMEK